MQRPSAKASRLGKKGACGQGLDWGAAQRGCIREDLVGGEFLGILWRKEGLGLLCGPSEDTRIPKASLSPSLGTVPRKKTVVEMK